MKSTLPFICILLQVFLVLAAQADAECAPFIHIVASGIDRTVTPDIRQKEYEDAMAKNLANPHVKSYHVFWERGIDEPSLSFLDDRSRSKIVHASTNVGRMKYADGFRYANDKLRGEVVVQINSDIVLGKGFDCSKLSIDQLGLNKLLMPVRHEDDSCPGWRLSHYKCDCRKWTFDNVLSNCFDVLVYRAPVPNRLASDEATGFLMGGVWGAEQVLAAEAHAAGMEVTSPRCDELSAHHYHCSQLRPYHTGPGLVAAKTYEREKEGKACYAEFCRNLCIKPSTADGDKLAKLCANFDKCKKFERTVYRKLTTRPYWLLGSFMSLGVSTGGGGDEFYQKSVVCTMDTEQFTNYVDEMVIEQESNFQWQVWTWTFVGVLIAVIVFVERRTRCLSKIVARYPVLRLCTCCCVSDGSGGVGIPSHQKKYAAL